MEEKEKKIEKKEETTTVETPKTEGAIDKEAKEQLQEMEQTIEQQEEKEKEKEAKKIDEEFKKEEGRSEKPKEETREERYRREELEQLEHWNPKTSLGKDVKEKKITTLTEAFEDGRKIMEAEIIDYLYPNLTIETLNIGQAKGKFGGGKRRPYRQTQKKTKEGNVLKFGVMAVVGDKKGHVGIGYGRASETLPAKEKAVRKAKLNMIQLQRGCASYDCSCEEHHSIPQETTGKCSSVSVKLIPAPQGTGLVIGDEMKKILGAAGITDVYSRSPINEELIKKLEERKKEKNYTLHPPRGGLKKSSKLQTPKGILGYNKEITKLIERML
jgi:small subunit ribosomal protein S5